MSFLNKVKNYLCARQEFKQKSVPKNNDHHEVPHQLSAAECLDIAGGPQIQNNPR